MSAFNDIIEGINQAIDYEKGNLKNVRKKVVMVSPVPHYKSIDVKNIRNALNLSQALFASLLGVSVKTVEAWESGRNMPEGPAQRMLELLKNNPDIINEYILVK
jgi:putative transcriptional regulator